MGVILGKNRYYNNRDIKRIERMVSEKRLEEALACYMYYINKYPEDIGARCLYTDILIKLGRFGEAWESLDRIEYHYNDKTLEKFIQKVSLIRTKLLCCEERYGEAYESLEKNKKYFLNKYIDYICYLLFLKKKLGILTEEDNQYTNYNYTLSQILDYNEDYCLQHLSRHQSYEGNPNPNQFLEDFPLKDTYFKLRKGLPRQERLYSSIINYKIIFKYISNGRVNGKITDYFEVVAFHGSNDIITMYPYLNTERRACIDITPDITENSNGKVKRMSQIDKFNQRYQK